MYQKALKQRISSALETLHSKEFTSVSEYLTDCYDTGFIGTMYNLHGQSIPLMIPIDQEQVVQAIIKDTKLSESLYNRLGKDIKTLKKQIASELSVGILIIKKRIFIFLLTTSNRIYILRKK